MCRLAARIAAGPRTLPGQESLNGVHVLRTLDDALALQLGPVVAGALADLHTAHGTNLCLGAGVTGLTSEHGQVTGVTVAGGDVLPADLVVVAFGATPATEWLTSSGLRLDNGVVCDARCRTAEGIYAAGDVARWHHESLDVLLRHSTIPPDAEVSIVEGLVPERRFVARFTRNGTPLRYWAGTCPNKRACTGRRCCPGPTE